MPCQKFVDAITQLIIPCALLIQESLSGCIIVDFKCRSEQRFFIHGKHLGLNAISRIPPSKLQCVNGTDYAPRNCHFLFWELPDSQF